MEQVLLEIIREINPFDDVNSDTDLLGEGVLDSLSLMLFIEETEERLKIEIPEEEVNSENFYSVNTVIELINRIK